MNTDIPVRPQHKVCERNVEVPAILVVPSPEEDGEPEVVVQWFGEAEDMDLGEMQFLFPVPVSADALAWMNHPELFKVILLGQIKDWPTKEAVQAVADSFAKGNVDAWILWVTSSHYGTKHRSGVGPACFAVRMNILLADGVCGVITPRKYCDVTVLDRENERFSQLSAS